MSLNRFVIEIFKQLNFILFINIIIGKITPDSIILNQFMVNLPKIIYLVKILSQLNINFLTNT